VRTAGVTRPRRAAASSSRAVRESTETTSPRWLTRRCFRRAVRRAPVWRWPGRATDSSSGNARARWPRQHAAQSRGPGEERPEPKAWCFERRADLRLSEDRCSGPRQASHKDLEPPVGGLVTTAREKSSSADRSSSRVPHLHQRVRESIIPGPLPTRPGTARVGEALSVAGCPDPCPEGGRRDRQGRCARLSVPRRRAATNSGHTRRPEGHLCPDTSRCADRQPGLHRIAGLLILKSSLLILEATFEITR
jgi:hypothetical protein